MHLLEIEITYRCNLNCRHCYNRYERVSDMPLEDICRQMEAGLSHGLRKLIITGGEACMHPQFEELCRRISRLRERYPDTSFVLQSNGRASEVDGGLLKAFDIVHLSYDYDGTTVRRMDAGKLIEFAHRLQNNGIYAYFFTTVTSENCNLLDEITGSANAAGVPIAFNICSFNESGGGYLLDTRQKLDVFKKLYSLEQEGKIRPFKHPYMSIIRNMSSEKYIGNRGGCTAGIASCVIKADGSVIACPFLREPAGNVYDAPLEDIWAGSELLMKMRRRDRYDVCGQCEHISYCGGCRKSALEFSGKIDGFDGYCFKHIAQIPENMI